MEARIVLAREDAEIRRIVSTAMENISVQGVVLDLDVFWLTAWNYTRRYGNEGFDRALRQIEPWPFSYQRSVTSFDEFLVDLPENLLPVWPMHVNDLGWQPPHWTGRAEALGFNPSQPPVRVTICLRPGTTEAPRIESGQYRILYETRPVATLSANPRRYRRPVVGGLSTGVGATVCGTMGGIVREQDPPQRMYGMTCAHVMTAGAVDQPAQVDSKRAAPIGLVSSHSPLQLPVGQCTPYATAGVNAVDAALIEINPTTGANLEVLDIGPLTGITPRTNIVQGQVVEFTGRTSGHRTVKVGGLGVIYQLRWAGQTYCFQNLIQLSWPKFYQLMGGRPVTRGDSGAWICNPDPNGFGWCGMIIGNDRLHGYAVYAQTIEEWWQQQGLALTVT